MRSASTATAACSASEFDQYARCGWSLDLSGAICDRAMFHADNCYYLPAAEIVSHRCRTNTVSNTAFRGFGGPQGMVGIERVMDEIAHALGTATRWKCGQVNLLRGARRPRRPGHDAVPYGSGRLRRRGIDRRSLPHLGLRIPPRGDPRVQRQQPDPEARHRPDPGQVRHFLHHHLPESGRRAGAHLPRRFDHAEPWRDRNGPGPVHQGRPGRRRGLRHRPGQDQDYRDADRQSAEHLGDGGVVRFRSQRQSGRERLPNLARAPRRRRCRPIRRHARLPFGSSTIRSMPARTRSASPSWSTGPT